MSDELVVSVIESLEALDIPYMVVGSLSSNYYGVARGTHDADFVVQLPPEKLTALATRLRPALRLDPQICFETVTATTRHIFFQPEGQFKIEVFLLSDDPHDQMRFARRRMGAAAGRRAYLPSVEDVIVMKLRWSKGGKRSKDIGDVKAVIATQGDAIDWTYVYPWCDQHGTREILDQIRASIRPQ